MSQPPRKRLRRGDRRASARPPSCGAPECLDIAEHLVVDPRRPQTRLGACESHWPDLVALVWSLGGRVSDCACPECAAAGQTPGL